MPTRRHLGGVGKEDSKTTEDLVGVNVLGGRIVRARYTPQMVPLYQGVKTVEALGNIMTEDEVVAGTAVFPPYDESVRNRSADERLASLTVLEGGKIVVPLPQFLTLAQSLSRMIRSSLVDRYPLVMGHFVKTPEVATRVVESLSRPAHPNVATYGLTILGDPGMGKTTLVNSVLGLMPQVIQHRSDGLMVDQITYLMVEAPHNGILKGLAQDIIHAFDLALGTSYEDRYCKSHSTANTLVAAVATLCTIHQLGVLIVDETHRLDRIDGVGTVLDFLSRIANVTHVPIVLVGLPKVEGLLIQEAYSARRFSSQGIIDLQPLKEDETYDYFLDGIWKYRFTRMGEEDDKEPTPEIRHLIYEKSGGNLEQIVKVFRTAQEEAINGGEEEITSEILDRISVTHNRFMARRRRQQGPHPVRRQERTPDGRAEAIRWVMDGGDFDLERASKAVDKAIEELGLDVDAGILRRRALDVCMGRTKRKTAKVVLPPSSSRQEPVGSTVMSLVKEAKAQGRSAYEALKEHEVIADVASWLARV